MSTLRTRLDLTRELEALELLLDLMEQDATLEACAQIAAGISHRILNAAETLRRKAEESFDEH